MVVFLELKPSFEFGWLMINNLQDETKKSLGITVRPTKKHNATCVKSLTLIVKFVVTVKNVNRQK